MSNSNLKKPKNEEEVLDVVDYLDRFANWTEKHAKTMILGFLGFTFLVAAFWGVSAMKTRALNVAAQETGVVNRRVDLLEKAISDTTDKTTAEFKAAKETELGKIQKEAMLVVEKHSSKAVADFTAVRWAAYLVKQDKEDMALEVLNKAKPSGDRELSAASLFLKGSILSKKGQKEDAMASYDKVLSEKSWNLFHAEAYIQKGALLQEAGKTDEAIQAFDQARSLNKDSAFAKDAAKYKRLLELKKNHPEIFKSEG